MESNTKYFLSFDSTLNSNDNRAMCNKMEFKTLNEAQQFKNYLESLHEGKEIYFKIWSETKLVINLI